MANVKIGPDGSIIKDDEIISVGNGTLIRDDGTIESTNIGGHSESLVTHTLNSPPVSPLESGSRHEDDIANGNGNMSERRNNGGAPVSQKVISEKEYDLEIQEGRIRNAFPKQWITTTVVLCVLGVMGLYFLFIPAVFTSIMVALNLHKKAELEAERNRMQVELYTLKDRNRL